MSEIFDQSTTFEQLGLRKSILKGVDQAGFTYPTSIQSKLIPIALRGNDIIGQAKTGTGKTAAFGLPILHQADKDVPLQSLILTPTRELAAQVTAELEELGRFTPIRAFCIIGGESMQDQIRKVKDGAHIMVGTPGRIMDLHARKQIHFNKIRFVVLDEVDRMLDIGFRDDIRKILHNIKQPHQTMFVSATVSDEIERLGRTFMKSDAVRIGTTSGALTVSLVDQKYLPVEPWDKKQLLLHLLKNEELDSTVIFCRTKATVHRVTQYLRQKRIDAREIHGDMPQTKRSQVMHSMRQGSLDVLVASDLAARGLDVDHISHVINYDLPDDSEIYVHRIGRTARAGRRGIAWSFVTPDQGQRLTDIEKLAGVLIERLEYPTFKPGPVPADVRDQQKKPDRQGTPVQRLGSRVQPSTIDQLPEGELARRFPGGIIPKTVPPRTLGARFRSHRKGKDPED